MVYELCPKRWEAEYQDRVDSPAGSAANLGTACHAAMQTWVEDGHHLLDLTVEQKAERIGKLFDREYERLFGGDYSRRDEGRSLCGNWAQRTSFEGVTVLSTERKREIMLNTRHGLVPFRFIMDLELQHVESGDVEIVDYKTVARPIPAADLKNRLQCRAYAAMAHLMHPDAPRIWVTFDLLRFDAIGVVFTRQECIDTLDYLVRLAERIIEDTDPVETINAECRFCVRKEKCQKLRYVNHHKGGHSPGAPLAAQVAAMWELQQAKGAIEGMLRELETLITAEVSNEPDDLIELENGFSIGFTSSRRRVIDMERLVEALPEHDLASIATVGVTKLDELLNSGTLPADVASRVRQTVTWAHGKPSLKIRKM